MKHGLKPWLVSAAALLGSVAVFLNPASWCADPDSGAALLPEMLMLDPGHGGDDAGLAYASAGVTEKEFTLKVALALKDVLAKNPACTVGMTRSRDVSLSLTARQAMAGSKNAAFYLSLHGATAAGKPKAYLFIHRVGRDVKSAEALRRAQAQKIPAVPWDLAQEAVGPQSRQWARRIGKAWESMSWGRGERADVVIQEIPAAGLAGVQAPAVLIEMPLPESVTPKTFPVYCQRAAGALAEALNDFFINRR